MAAELADHRFIPVAVTSYAGMLQCSTTAQLGANDLELVAPPGVKIC